MKADKLIARRIQDIQDLKNVIYDLRGCESEYVGAEAVTDYLQDEIVWSGTVNIFNIRGHLSASRCYAWTHAKGKRRKPFMAVLELPPVDSPQTAVKAVLSETKNATRKPKKV